MDAEPHWGMRDWVVIFVARMAPYTSLILTPTTSNSVDFDSIAVALVGMAHPLGTIFSGLLFGALRTGVLEMTVRFGTPKALALVVEGLTVLFLAFEKLYRVKLLREGRV